MPSRSRSPSRKFGLFDLAEDFFSALIDIMSLGFSVHHLKYALDPLPSGKVPGDPPPEGSGRYMLTWSPYPGEQLSPELDQILLERLPVRSVIHPTQAVTNDWRGVTTYVLYAIASGEV